MGFIITTILLNAYIDKDFAELLYKVRRGYMTAVWLDRCAFHTTGVLTATLYAKSVHLVFAPWYTGWCPLDSFGSRCFSDVSIGEWLKSRYCSIGRKENDTSSLGQGKYNSTAWSHKCEN